MNCPRCNEPPYPAGKFVITPIIRFQQRVKVFFFWVTAKLSFGVHYCQKCGFLAVRDVSVG